MKNLKTFEECCRYLGISEELPKCQIDERQIQALYKLRICMKAWNKKCLFECNETTIEGDDNEGWSPYFEFRDGVLYPRGIAYCGSYGGLLATYVGYNYPSTPVSFGVRINLEMEYIAVEFSKVFIDIFRELV